MKNNCLVIGIFCLALVLPACAGTVYHEKVDLGGGDVADVVGRTGVFGTDLAAVRFKSQAPDDPDILRLGSYESERTTTQTYDQRCPDPRQLKNIKTTTVNREKNSYQDVANPNKRQDQIAVIGGTNPSTGNQLLPAAANGAGAAFSGGTTNLVQGGAEAVVKGVSARSGSKVGPVTNTSIIKDSNSNTNGNTNTNANGNANGNNN